MAKKKGTKSVFGLKVVCCLCVLVVIALAILFLTGVAKVENMQAFDEPEVRQTRTEKDALMQQMNAAYLHKFGSAFGEKEKYAGASTMGIKERVGANLPSHITVPRLPALRPVGVHPYANKENLSLHDESLTLDVLDKTELDALNTSDLQVELVRRDRYTEDLDTLRGGDKFVYVEKKVGRSK